MVSVEKAKIEIYCEWCGHKDKYFCRKEDQPKCKKCLRSIPKKQRL